MTLPSPILEHYFAPVIRLTETELDVEQISSRISLLNGQSHSEAEIRKILENDGFQRTGSDTHASPQHIKYLTNRSFQFGSAKIILQDCFDWIHSIENLSIHAVVTDPPYGLHEYTPDEQRKLRARRGGVWRLPPAFDGHARSPLPRFTTLNNRQRADINDFFFVWARYLLPKLVPGANVIVASNPLVSHIVAGALGDAGLERRGEIIRLVTTMRGGDRPKGAHEEFEGVSVLPRSMWEPWITFRKPIEGRVQDNLRKWQTGGFRRPSDELPFGDVIRSHPTGKKEREIAPHPSLKPQDFLRPLVRAVLPLGQGIILDPFSGAGSTLAAAEAVGYRSMGVEKDPHYFEVAQKAIPALAKITTR